MKKVTTTDAVKKWGEVLDMVKGGEPVTLTSHGRAVARMLGMPRAASGSDLDAVLDGTDRGRAAKGAIAEVREKLMRSGWEIDGPFLTRAAVAIADGLFRAEKKPR